MSPQPCDSRFCRACVRQEVRVLEGRRVSRAFNSRSVLRQCDRACGTSLVREYDGKSGKGWIEETLMLKTITPLILKKRLLR